MRKIIFSLVMVAVLCSANAYASQKIGFFSLKEVLTTSEPAVQATEKRNAYMKKVQADLMKERKEIQEMQVQREKQKAMLKPDALEEMDRKIRERVFKARENQKQAQSDMKEKQQQWTQPVLEKLGVVVENYAKKEGYTAIFDRDRGYYVAPGADITDKIIQELNKAWKK